MRQAGSAVIKWLWIKGLVGGAMRRLVLLLVGLLVLGTMAVAQDAAKVEIFGGYQYLRVNPGQGLSGENFNGWNGAVTGYVNSWLGITGDISGSYKNGVHIYTFMGGPTLSPARSKSVVPFVHALFGEVRASGGGITDNSFGMAWVEAWMCSDCTATSASGWCRPTT
jgi:hypothetical protein